jgi:hypothetical protein
VTGETDEMGETGETVSDEGVPDGVAGGIATAIARSA